MKENKKNTKLSEMNKENPFNVPDNYFNDFYTNLESKINKLEIDERPIKKSNIHYLRPFLAIAASFLIIMMTLQYWPMLKMSNTIAKTEQITTDEIDNDYLDIISDNYSFSSYYTMLSEPVDKDLNSDEIIE